MIRREQNLLQRSRLNRLNAYYANYTTPNSFPQKGMGAAVDDKSTLESLEERVNHLTVGMENIQKTLDRFVTLYESEKSQTLAKREDLEKLKNDAVIAKNREKQLEMKVVGMRLQMDILTSNCTRDKLQWEQERDQLQKELQHYESLSQKGPTDNSSTQTTELFDETKSQCVAETKQDQCNERERNSQYACTTVKTQFAQRINLDEPTKWRLRAISPKVPIKKVMIREYAEIQQSQKCAAPQERHEQKSEQKLQEPVVAQSERLIELSSISSQAAPESNAQTTNPPSHPTANHSKSNARQQLLVSLLEKHDCEDSECPVLAFRNCMKHATECIIGSECSWFICKRMHARIEHLKVCDNKSRCILCQQGSNIANEGKIREIVMLLENTCFPKGMSTYSKNASTREAIIDLAVRVAVNYGLICDNETIVDTKITHLNDMADGESSSFSFSESSANEEEIWDEGDSSEGEKTAEEWEIIES